MRSVFHMDHVLSLISLTYSSIKAILCLGLFLHKPAVFWWRSCKCKLNISPTRVQQRGLFIGKYERSEKKKSIFFCDLWWFILLVIIDTVVNVIIIYNAKGCILLIDQRGNKITSGNFRESFYLWKSISKPEYLIVAGAFAWDVQFFLDL